MRHSRSPRLILAALLVFSGVLLLSDPASAHSFLVTTTPAQGERLTTPPDAIVLELSESVAPSGVRLNIRTAGGDRVELARTSSADRGLAVRAPVAGTLEKGIYVVAWEAVSDVDGHGSFGEFSFAVGSVRGSLPAASTSSSAGPWSRVASWLFTSGFALAAGSLVLSRLETSGAAGGRRWVRAGLVAAIGGAALAWTERVSAGSSDGLLPATLTLALLLVAVSAHALVKDPAVPLLISLGAAAAWSARSHGASLEGAFGAAVDFVHLSAGGIWAGALVIVTVHLWRTRGGGSSAPIVAGYARLALALVVLLAVAGIASASLLVPTWGDLWSTGYGRLLLVKTALFFLAVALAAASRLSWLRRGRMRVLRLSISTEAAVVIAVLVVAGLLANVPPPAPASAAEAILGPRPLEGPLTRDAGLAGQLNVEVVADGSRLDIRVFSPSGPVPGTETVVAMSDPAGDESDLVPRPCGSGCSTQELDLDRGVTMLAIDASAPGWTGGRFDARLGWPPGPRAVDRLDQVIAATRAVPRVTVTELVSSGPGTVSPESTFEMTGDDLIDVEPYAGGNVAEVRLLPGSPEQLSLYVPGSQIYVVLELDAQGRMVGSRLISPGHDIRRRFTYPSPRP